MTKSVPRIGITGCGFAARVHPNRLTALEGVQVVGGADCNPAAAEVPAARVPVRGAEPPAASFIDHRKSLRQTSPDSLAIFTPHLNHHRPAMDALQCGCHVFIEKPLSTNVQEAADIVGLARGRNRKVGVGHQDRLCPSLVEARRRLAAGTIGPTQLVRATLAQPWLVAHGGAEDLWRFDPKLAGGGLLADAGDHPIDALLWTTGQVAVEVAAIRHRLDSGLDLVTAAALRLADGTPATLAPSGVAPAACFEFDRFRRAGTPPRHRSHTRGGTQRCARAGGLPDRAGREHRQQLLGRGHRRGAPVSLGRPGPGDRPAPGGGGPFGNDRTARPARLIRT